MAAANSGEIDGRIAILYHCMAHLTVYLLEASNSKSVARHLRYPGKLERSRRRRLCTGPPVDYEGAIREGGCGECVRVHRCTMSEQSGRRMRRVCTGTPVHYEQTVREEDAASVYGYTGTL